MSAPTVALVARASAGATLLECYCLLPTLPCLGTRKDPQAEARSDDTATSPQLSVRFITTKLHRACRARHKVQESSLQGRLRREAIPAAGTAPLRAGAEPLGSNMAGPEAGSRALPHGNHPSWLAAASFRGCRGTVRRESPGCGPGRRRLPSLLPCRHCCPGPRTEAQVSGLGSLGLTHTGSLSPSVSSSIFKFQIPMVS